MTTKILRLRARTRRRGNGQGRSACPTPPVRATVLTRAELAECTCPDACERDHEHD